MILKFEGESMYRLLIEGEEWIVRFSSHLSIEAVERDIIVAPLNKFGSTLSKCKHGDSFVIMNENIGLIVCRVEKIPSFILNISTVVPKEKCFVEKDGCLLKWYPK
jgi:hypothetical protein